MAEQRTFGIDPDLQRRLGQLVPDEFSGVISVMTRAGVDGREGVGAQIARGLAYRPESVPVTPSTRFGIASGTKGFTAVATVRLALEGRLELDAPLETVLPGMFPQFDPEITVWHLLTHTSGIGDYCDEEEDCDFEAIWRERPVYAFNRPADFTPLFEDLPAKCAPGARFAYNNAAYIVLGMVVERCAGAPFPAAVRHLVFEPFGMEQAGFFRADRLPAGCATGYLKARDDGWRSNVFSIPAIGGADGGAYVSAEDMHRYWAALLGPDCNNHGLRDLLLETRVPVPRSDDPPGQKGSRAGYSLGHWISDFWGDSRFYFLTGWDPGVSFLSGYCPEDGRTFVILCNVDEGLTLVWPKLQPLILGQD